MIVKLGVFHGMKRERRALGLAATTIAGDEASVGSGTTGDLAVSLEETLLRAQGGGGNSISAGLSTFLKNMAMDFEGGAGGAALALAFGCTFGVLLVALVSFSAVEFGIFEAGTASSV